jgi:hypothetical protein
MGIIIRNNSGEIRSFLDIEDGLAYEAKLWRDEELKSTDYIVGVTDHPQHSEYLAYRANLRDWPLIDTFPISSSKPTL